jgi:FkbM family methyltransferase
MGKLRDVKELIKYASRKYLNYDPGLRKVKIGEDFLDQKKLLSSEDVKVIFDVGANVGQTTQKYRKLFPNAKVYGFEPFPHTYKEYVKKFRGDFQVHPVNIALSNVSGTANFFVNNNHYTNSLLPIDRSTAVMLAFNTVEQIDVQTDTLDAFCEKNGIHRIDILKLDIQGAEILALKGATHLLTNGVIKLIYSEVEYVSYYQNQPLFEDIKKYLECFKYSLYETYNTAYSEFREPMSGDAIFLKPILPV